MTLRPAIRPLPARAAALPGESLASLVRRTALAMGYEGPGRVLSLLSETGDVPANANLFPPGPSLHRLAELLRRPAEDLLGMTVHRFSRQLVLAPRGSPSDTLCDSKTILKYFVTGASPICPLCLKEDPIPFERLAWSFRALPVCLSHGCLLVWRCPACQRSLRRDRATVSRCPCGGLLQEAPAQPVSSQMLELARTLEQLLMERAIILSKMPPAATLWWAERLAAAVAKTPVWMESVAKRMDLQAGQQDELILWLSAAEMFSSWPKGLEEFLDVFQQVTKHRTTSTGISRRFGLLLREAAHLEEIGYAAPADALRDHLLKNYAAGHLSGKVCLFQGRANRSSLSKRPWISQTEAARLLRIRGGTITSLVTRGVLVGQIHPAGKHGRSVGLVLRQSVESLRLDLQSALDVCAAARRLAIGRHAVLDLIHTDLLPGAVRTAEGWKIPLRSVQDLEAVCAGLPTIKGQSAGWISLRQATRVAGSSGLALSRLLRLIQVGSLKARVAEPQKGLNGIVVSQAGLAAAQREVHDRGDPSSDWTLHHAARSLFPGRPVKAYVLKRWIRGGLLKAHAAGPRTIVSTEEIKRFRAEFCLAQEATQVLGISRTTLSRWEAQGRIVPVYGRRVTPQAGFSLYRREDVRRLAGAAS